MAHQQSSFQRFDSLLEYIHRHLDKPLSLDQLSDMACCSKYHFHRQFSAWLGMPVQRYIQQQRLKRSAHQLRFTDLPVTEIGLDAGFGQGEGFSRAFTQLYGQSPSAFRRQPHTADWFNQSTALNSGSAEGTDEVELINWPDMPVAMISHVGSLTTLDSTIQRFISWRKTQHLPPSKARTFNLLYADPYHTPQTEQRLDIAVQYHLPVSPNVQGVVAGLLPAGRCGRLRHIGPWSGLEQSVGQLYQWASKQGMSLRDFPCFVERINLYPDVSEADLISDIYLPLV